MNLKTLYGLMLLVSGCASSQRPAASIAQAPASAAAAVPAVAPSAQVNLFDSARQRVVPVALYQPRRGGRKMPWKAAILSPGYGGRHTAYSFIAQNLVAHGYFVVSIQHELPTDEPIPTTGIPRVVRRPHWERGVQNILFVRRTLQKQYPGVDFEQLLLVGHSNGGDTAMLFAEEHPALVQRIISLDNRRMPLPRARRPQVLSLRSSDQVADAGVLPTAAEQQQWGSTIVKLPNTLHNDMWDGATATQKEKMNKLISRFLEQ